LPKGSIRGWLTAEEREAVDHARAALKTRAWQFRNGLGEGPQRHDTHAAESCEQSEEILLALLARSTPPEVVLPPMVIAYDDMDMLKEALDAAGVAVKEVAKPELPTD
jgi:hypothetical protein